MRVVITGSHGLIGARLAAVLRDRGDDVVPLARPAGPSAGPRDPTGRVPADPTWDPDRGVLDPAVLAGATAVVHLAGAPITPRRWTADLRRRILDSRVRGTALLARTLAATATPRPAVLVSASAVGYYGDRGEEVLDEASPPGHGFLCDVCRRWEQAAEPATTAGVRTVLLRTGIVLAADGGALATQRPLFERGLGARLGNGRQWMSWISLADEVGAILHALDRDDVAGPVNAVGPDPVRNADYTRTLGAVLNRPAGLVTPPFALRALLGAEVADEMLLVSQRVLPRALTATGYRFRHPNLEAALRAAVAR